MAGKDFDEGKGECIVSRNLTRSLKGARIGGRLKFGDKEEYQVVGLFTAGGSVAESEVWADLKDVEKNIGREGSVSSVQLRAATPRDYENLRKTIDGDTQFKLAAIPESLYFESQTRSGTLMKVMGTAIAVLLTLGAMFASANTMFAAVKSRTREIGTMRALGFSQYDVLISFLSESLILCTLGGALGLLATLPLSALTLDTNNFNTFASVTIKYRFGPLVMAVAPDDDPGHGPVRWHDPRDQGRSPQRDLGLARTVRKSSACLVE